MIKCDLRSVTWETVQGSNVASPDTRAAMTPVLRQVFYAMQDVLWDAVLENAVHA